jgi:hypothetical protein
MIKIKRTSGRLGKRFAREWLLPCYRFLNNGWLVFLQKPSVILSIQVKIVKRRGYVCSRDILQLGLKSGENDI